MGSKAGSKPKGVTGPSVAEAGQKDRREVEEMEVNNPTEMNPGPTPSDSESSQGGGPEVGGMSTSVSSCGKPFPEQRKLS